MSSRLDYLRDGQAIYARSFAMIRAEADLARFSGTAERVVVRMIHACGMTDLPKDVEASEDFAASGEAARSKPEHRSCAMCAWSPTVSPARAFPPTTG